MLRTMSSSFLFVYENTFDSMENQNYCCSQVILFIVSSVFVETIYWHYYYIHEYDGKYVLELVEFRFYINSTETFVN